MIVLYTHNASLTKAVRTALSPRWVDQATQPVRADRYEERPQFLVTTGRMSIEMSRYAMLLGALVVVLPEAGAWLAEKVSQAEGPVYLAGWPLHKNAGLL